MSNDLIYAGSALHAALAAGTIDWYRNLAPGTATPPFGVWSLQSGTDEYDFGGRFVDFTYNVRVIDDAEWASRAENLYSAADSLIQNVSLSITGQTTLQCRRTSTQHFRDPDGFWNVGGLYRVWVHN